MSNLTHFNEQGRAMMVDVTDKPATFRVAVAKGYVLMNISTMNLIKNGGIKKGDVLAVAQVAGIMGVKKTSDLIPMCHNININSVDISFTLIDSPCSVMIQSEVKCKGETGVEMEALTAVSIAALTIYDMCKAVQRDMKIVDIHLVSKTGGKSGDYNKEG